VLAQFKPPKIAIAAAGGAAAATPHIVRKPGKMFKKSQKFNVMDLIENNMGGP
jgi:hypothetical protein